MKTAYGKTMLITLFLFLAVTGCQSKPDPNRALLPENFKIYTNGVLVVTRPTKGFQEKVLPTNNDYRDYPGCYVICYSKSNNNAVYAIDKTTFVYGQLRVPGEYYQRMCVTRNKNPATFKKLCQEKIKTCSDAKCWVGGDTGAWFGIK